MKRRISVIYCFLLLILTCGVGSGPYASSSSDDWSMFRHDNQHTGHTTADAPTNGGPIWSFEANDAVTSSPAVAGGKVYISSHDGFLYALDAENGDEIWSHQIGDWGGFTFPLTGIGDRLLSSPAVSHGKVYVGSWDNKLYAIDADTGEEIWSFKTGGQVDSSPSVAYGKVYVGSRDNKLYAIDAVSGEFEWAYETGNIVTSSPAVWDNKVYIGSRDGNVYCLWAGDGKKVWSYETGDIVHSSPAVSGGLVYVGSRDGKVYALNGDNGNVLWIRPLPSEGLWSYGFKLRDNYVNSSPAVAYGKVYIGSYNWRVYALDAHTGEEIWFYETEYPIGYSSPAVSQGRVYIGSYDGRYYALDAENGDEIWSFEVLGKSQRFGYAVSSPAVADNKVYVSSSIFENEGSQVYALGSPLDIKVEKLEVEPKEVEVGKHVTISVKVRNQSGLGGPYVVRVGVYRREISLFQSPFIWPKIKAKRLDLPPRGTRSAVFRIPAMENGLFEIRSGNLSENFKIVPPIPKEQFPIFYAIGAVVFGLCLLLVFLWRLL